MIQINKNPSRRELRQFGIIWLCFFAVLGSVIWYKRGTVELSLWLWSGALVVALAGFIMPAFMRLVFLGMSYLAWPIGWTISHLVLAVVYYVLITPIGLIMKMAGRDPMARQLDRDADSYWKEHRPIEDAARYFRQF